MMAGILTTVERFAMKRRSITDFAVCFKKSALLNTHHFHVENEHEKFMFIAMNKCSACLQRLRIPIWSPVLAGAVVFRCRHLLLRRTSNFLKASRVLFHSRFPSGRRRLQKPMHATCRQFLMRTQTAPIWRLKAKKGFWLWTLVFALWP